MILATDILAKVELLANVLAHASGFGAGAGCSSPWLDSSALEALNLSQSADTQVAWASLNEIEGLVGLQPEMQRSKRVAVGAGLWSRLLRLTTPRLCAGSCKLHAGPDLQVVGMVPVLLVARHSLN